MFDKNLFAHLVTALLSVMMNIFTISLNVIQFVDLFVDRNSLKGP